MLAAVRKEKVKEYLLEYKNASVTDLSKLFSVSEETIRRDLKALEDAGYVIRTHVGAVLSQPVSKTVDNSALEKIFVKSKELIANQCRAFIHDGDCIYLDASTTAATICATLQDIHVTVLTNSLRIINKLSSAENIKLICVGGNLLHSRECFVGRTANDALNRYFVDIAFISCRSVSIENGITDSDDDDAETKQIISSHANRVCLIADHSKFGKTSFAHVCDFTRVNDIVTDMPVSEEWLHFAQENNINIWDTRPVSLPLEEWSQD